MFKLYIDYLKENGVDSQHIISINLKNPEYSFDNFMDLYNYVNNKITDDVTYFQVADTTRDEKTLERELSALQSINDYYPKYILTMDVDPVCDYNGIKKVNVLDWLIDKKSND